MDLKQKLPEGETEGHFILIKSKVHQGDITMIHVPVSNAGALNLIKTNTASCKVTGCDD